MTLVLLWGLEGEAPLTLVREALTRKGVPTAVHYPIPLHRQPAYAEVGLVGGPLDVAEQLSAEVLSLPMHPYLTEADQDRVVDAVRRAVAA